jgi:rubrerythrin
MASWFYRTNRGREQGPVASSELLELIRTGAIDGETEVRKDDSHWVPANQVNGLWQAVGKPTVVFKCPECGSLIDKPPAKCNACEKVVNKAVGQLHVNSRPANQTASWAKTEPIQNKPKAPPLQ